MARAGTGTGSGHVHGSVGAVRGRRTGAGAADVPVQQPQVVIRYEGRGGGRVGVDARDMLEFVLGLLQW